jgi:hypothetical protein
MPRPEPLSRATVAPASAADAESSLRFSLVNLALLGGGLAAVVAGFMLLGGGSTIGAPLLLMLGFAVLVPLGIIL